MALHTALLVNTIEVIETRTRNIYGNAEHFYGYRADCIEYALCMSKYFLFGERHLNSQVGHVY